MSHLLRKIFLPMALLVAGTSPTAADQSEAAPVAPNVAVLGDSLTWLGGDDCTQSRGWTKWFVKAYRPSTCHSYARSGATWCNTTSTRTDTVENIGVLGDNNVVYNQMVRLDQAVDAGRQPLPDLLIIALGTNDMWFADKRPEALNGTPAEALAMLPGLTDRQPDQVRTLAESVVYVCSHLRQRYPQARIVLLTPPQTAAVDNSLITRAGDIIAECARLMDIEAIRMDRVGAQRHDTEARHHTYTYDGTHTNATGARRNGETVARIIAQKVKSGK